MGSSILFLENDAVKKPNLLQNPGFELLPGSFNGIPKGWMVIGTSEDYVGKVTSDGSVTINGSNSIKVQGTRKSVMIISDPFNIDRYGGYFAKLSALSTEETGPKVRLRVYAYSANGKLRNTFSSTIRTSTTWKKATLSAGLLRSNVRYGRIVLIVPATKEGAVWLDGVACYEAHRFNR